MCVCLSLCSHFFVNKISEKPIHGSLQNLWQTFLTCYALEMFNNLTENEWRQNLQFFYIGRFLSDVSSDL